MVPAFYPWSYTQMDNDKLYRFNSTTFFRISGWLCLGCYLTGLTLRRSELHVGAFERLIILWAVLLICWISSNIRFAAWVSCFAAFIRCRVGDDKVSGGVLDFNLPLTQHGHLIYSSFILIAGIGFVLAFPGVQVQLRTLLRALTGYVVIAAGWMLIYCNFVRGEYLPQYSDDFRAIIIFCLAGQVIEIACYSFGRLARSDKNVSVH